MKTISQSILLFSILFIYSVNVYANYDRNKAVPVEKILFGKVISVKNITHEELIRDKKNGWHTFGGALFGGVIGNQFGGGNGKDITTILGAIIGGSIAGNSHKKPKKKINYLVELMIKIDNGDQFMVIQDYDSKMVFRSKDKIRMIYLANNTVRVDKQR
mgnify:CR=1 FL=1